MLVEALSRTSPGRTRRQQSRVGAYTGDRKMNQRKLQLCPCSSALLVHSRRDEMEQSIISRGRSNMFSYTVLCLQASFLFSEEKGKGCPLL